MMFKDLKINNRGYILLGFILFLICIAKDCNTDSIYYQDLLKLKNDTIRQYRNKLNQEVSTKKDIELNQISDLKLLNDSLYSEVKRLNKLKSIVTFRTQTIYKDKVITILGADTIYTDTGKVVFPVYESFITDKWISGSIKSSRDTTEYSINTFNEYVFTHQSKRGFIKQKPSIVTLTNKNPNAHTLGLESYSFKPKPKLINLSLQTGVGLTPKGVQPYFGVGASLNIR